MTIRRADGSVEQVKPLALAKAKKASLPANRQERKKARAAIQRDVKSTAAQAKREAAEREKQDIIDRQRELKAQALRRFAADT